MLILFIDDQLQNIEPVRMRIDEIPEAKTETCDFHEAADAISRLRPDIVILDVIQQGALSNPEQAGLDAFDFIWDQRFCPVVVHSAEPDRLSERESWEEHPFIQIVQKGSDSEDCVVQAILGFRHLVQAMRNTEAEVHRQLAEAMKVIAPIAAENIDNGGDLEETVMRSGRRRVAALMDEPLPGEAALAGWEQYIYPPVSEDVHLGDILLKKDSGNDPQSFRVVLTPSCDMVRSGKRSPKVQQVLVAKCCPMAEAFNILGLAKNSRIKSIKSRLLNPGYSDAIIPFPPLPNVIPAMAANLRDLELIPIDDIGDAKEFSVIASIDSPFRELVSWAYHQITCRPGLPERDKDAWAKEIKNAIQNPDNSN